MERPSDEKKDMERSNEWRENLQKLAVNNNSIEVPSTDLPRNGLEIVFVVEVQQISVIECKVLANKLDERDDFIVKELNEADGYEFILNYGSEEYIFSYSRSNKTLSTALSFWEEGQKPRDRWIGGGNLDGIINVLQKFSRLRNVIATVTEKKVVAVPRELR